MKPEEAARQQIDTMQAEAGWIVQDRRKLNLGTGPGIAVREFSLHTGYADYFLLVDRQAVGVIEAKPVGFPLTGVREQSAKYLAGVDDELPVARTPLPFHYETTGLETRFTSRLDPLPRGRQVFRFHRPETLRSWLEEAPEDGANQTLRARLQSMPALMTQGLRECQVEAIKNLEHSLQHNHPRALIQMATGSGKTYTAVNFIYRLIKFGGARRVLFLVDRDNLGKQTDHEFQQFMTPDDERKFKELYNVLHLQGRTIDKASRVCITTIQRLYYLLKGEEPPDEERAEKSLFEQEEEHYCEILSVLGKKPGMLGVIFRKVINKIQNPAYLRRLIVDLINDINWLTMQADVKGDAYEGLLEKNAEDTKSGAGQYFTLRPLSKQSWK